MKGYAQQNDTFNPKEHAVIKPERSDGRYLSSRGVVHGMLKGIRPRYAFRPDMTTEELKKMASGIAGGDEGDYVFSCCSGPTGS